MHTDRRIVQSRDHDFSIRGMLLFSDRRRIAALHIVGSMNLIVTLCAGRSFIGSSMSDALRRACDAQSDVSSDSQISKIRANSAALADLCRSHPSGSEKATER